VRLRLDGCVLVSLGRTHLDNRQSETLAEVVGGAESGLSSEVVDSGDLVLCRFARPVFVSIGHRSRGTPMLGSIAEIVP